jgi:cytochrome c oxidase subunit 2
MRRLATVLFLPFAAGCQYAALDHASPEAARITNLHNVMAVVCIVVYLVVVALLAVALRRPRAPRNPEGEERRRRAVLAGTIASSVVLLGFLAASVSAGSRITTPERADALEVRVTGHQWWWEVRYPSSNPSREVTTANEIHLPLGRTVRFRFGSGDVIHSFWAPNLDGKKDLLPGRDTSLTFRPVREGVFEGRCAEFCGYQHAHMGFLIVVDKPDVFEAWLNGQRRPAAEPADAVLEHGRQVFLASPCVTCHTIRGTGAFGHKAPDLTHLASRSTIAAATLPNNTGHLAGWVVDAQRIKPGSRMPPNLLPSGDLLDLVAYLRSLQ